MSGVELKANDAKVLSGTKRGALFSSLRFLPVLATVTAVAVGKEIKRLRRFAPRFVPISAVDAALQALAEGRSGEAIERLKDLDRLLAARPSAESASRILLRLRASILAISGQLAEFAPYFDDRAVR